MAQQWHDVHLVTVDPNSDGSKDFSLFPATEGLKSLLGSYASFGLVKGSPCGREELTTNQASDHKGEQGHDNRF